MVAGKVKDLTGQQMQKPTTRSQKTAEIAARKQSPLPLHPPPLPLPSSRTVFSRSFGVYFPRATAQVQPRPPDVTELLKVVEELRDREARLKTEILELKLVNESAAVLPKLEEEIARKDLVVEKSVRIIEALEMENERSKREVEEMRRRLEEERREHEAKVKEMSTMAAAAKTTTSMSTMSEIIEHEEDSPSQRLQGLIDASVKSNLIRNLKKSQPAKPTRFCSSRGDEKAERSSGSKSDEAAANLDAATSAYSQSLPILKPPPKSTFSPSPQPLPPKSKSATSPPPPPPPPPAATSKLVANKVKRVPEVVEFYHWLMRRDSGRETGGTVEVPQCSNSRDMIGEIENRSAYSLAIKTDVETKGDFIRMLIKEVNNAAFSSIENVLPFVKWLDEELSLLVDERAVLKHFEWPEQKADALREAAFGYSDLNKLEYEASVFRDDPRQSCGSALKKMQALFEKLEHAVYNLSHLRESASKKYKMYRIPLDWMLETGLVSQIKLASVKLAMKYVKRVSAELETVIGSPDELKLIVQGVKFAFRVHQFAGGFDAETMKAFKELKEKARTCCIQCHSQQ
ncbi:hypothetical protein QQ045_001776 [Rhodiola kirilowii]